MKIFISLLPSIYIVLTNVAGLGETQEAFVVDGEMVVVAIITTGVIWFTGYFAGRCN